MTVIIHRDRPDEAEEKMTPERRRAIEQELEALLRATREDKNEKEITCEREI